MENVSVKLNISEGIANVVFDSQGAVNAITNVFRREFEEVVTTLKNSVDELKGVVLQSTKSTFVVGADLNEINKIADESEEFLHTEVQRLHFTLRTLETLGIPVVSIINGSALGGGYEICLASHYRIAIENDTTRIGLPEASLSLMPGAGGTLRLPRLIGVEKALPLLMEGKQLRLDKSKQAGLIDELAQTEAQAKELAVQFIAENDKATQPWDLKGFRLPGGSPKSAESMMKTAIAPSMLRSKTQGRYPAPEFIMQSVFESLNVDFDTGIQIESDKFVALLKHPVSKSMVSTFWHQLNEIKRGAQRPNNFPKNEIEKVGIIGAGMMGAGIAYVTAKAGIETVLMDTSLEKANKGKQYSAGILNKKMKKGFVQHDEVDALLSLITPSDSAASLQGCDLIIEAVFENSDLKKRINSEAFPQLASSGFYASNTSSLPISDLARSVNEPEKFIGLHFFSPVDKMPLVEIIKGKSTNEETIAKSFDFVQQIGKTPILVNDSRGFYTSRVFATYVTEGMALLKEGISALKIENAAKHLGMPVSPLAVSDEVSISLAKHIRTEERLACETEGKDFKAHPADTVIEDMLDKFDRAGKAAGRGFYQYRDNGSKTLWEGLSEFETENDLEIETIQERLLFIQSLEAAKAVEEGVIISAGDANIGSIMGIGFAPWTGGTLEYINQVGIKNFCEKAKDFAERFGERYKPCQLLLDKAACDENFC